MSAKIKDITRWNRAGLSRFEYVNGNAPLYLEQLRKTLFEHFPDRWERLKPLEKIDKEDIPEELIEFETNEILLKNYYGERGDIGWELMRSFARACHVLAVQINAYANEAYLRTATQWEYIRRLAETIDYQPAPATSARTLLVLEAKPGQKGILQKGFQVKSPGTVHQVVFETFEDVLISHELNALRLKDYNKSKDPLVESPSDGQPKTPGLPPIAGKDAIAIEGVGERYSSILNSYANGEGFTIKDFIPLEPENGFFKQKNQQIPELILRKFKAKAEAAINLIDKKKWRRISNLTLPQILTISENELLIASGADAESVKELQSQVSYLRTCFHEKVFLNLTLEEFILPDGASKGFSEGGMLKVKTSPWIAPRKPKVEAEQAAIVVNEEKNIGKPVFINRIDPVTKKIELAYDPNQADWMVWDTDWMGWEKGVSRLLTSPFWQRNAWLNGVSVIRMDRPHGINVKTDQSGETAPETIVAWEKKGDNEADNKDNKWVFAKVKEADQFNLRIISEELPEEKDEIYEAFTINVTEKDRAFLRPKDVLAEGSLDGDLPPIEKYTATSLKNYDETFLDDYNSKRKQIDIGGFNIWNLLGTCGNLAMIAVVKLLADGITIPSTGERVAQLLEGLDFDLVNMGMDPMPTKLIPEQRFGEDSSGKSKFSWEKLGGTDEGELQVFFRRFAKGVKLPQKIHIVHLTARYNCIGKVVPAIPQYICNGTYDKLQPGTWIVAELNDKKHQAVKIRDIQQQKGWFSLTFEQLLRGELRKIYGDFRGELDPIDHDINNKPITKELVLDDKVPKDLMKQQKVVLMKSESPEVFQTSIENEVFQTSIENEVFQTSIKNINIENNTIIIHPPPPEKLGFTIGNLIIRGNVVTAGHGEVKPEMVLSAGTAPGPKQSILLQVDTISTIADSTMSRGFRADIEVTINGQTWKQVNRMDKSGPTDLHYTVRVSEEGYLKLIFGDGSHGRMLPAGTNNIRIRYRTGAGRIGNVSAGVLTTPAFPYPFVKTVFQPFDAKGGEERETAETIREKAPATILALERAVSETDFQNLAAIRPEIVRARAFLYPSDGGLLDKVEVVVVPVGGKRLEDHDLIKKDLQKYLQAHAVPTVLVSVESFKPVIAKLEVTIRVNHEQYRPEDVVLRTRQVLLDVFNPEKRDINQNLYLSEIYHVVDTVEGVEDSQCFFNYDDCDQQVVKARIRDVVFLKDTPENLVINEERYIQ